MASAVTRLEPDRIGVEGNGDRVGGDLGTGGGLKTMMENIWRDHITGEILDGLIDSMPARLQVVIDAEGNPIRY